MSKQAALNLRRCHEILRDRHTPISADQLASELDVHSRTVRRYVSDLKKSGIRVRTDRGRGFYLAKGNPDFEVPGLYGPTPAIEALLLIDLLLERLGSSFRLMAKDFLDQLEEYRARNHSKHRKFPSEKLRMVFAHKRKWNSATLEEVVHALAEKRRVRIDYKARSSETTTTREISIQHLVHYRDHWYIDAFDHAKEGLRIFALDRIVSIRRLNARSKECDEQEMETTLRSGYGVFAGETVLQAVLRFSKVVAPWVSEETWHDRQKAEPLEDGSFLLTVPYSNPTELLGEILRYGQEVEVLEPPELRESIRESLTQAAALYQ